MYCSWNNFFLSKQNVECPVRPSSLKWTNLVWIQLGHLQPGLPAQECTIPKDWGDTVFKVRTLIRHLSNREDPKSQRVGASLLSRRLGWIQDGNLRTHLSSSVLFRHGAMHFSGPGWWVSNTHWKQAAPQFPGSFVKHSFLTSARWTPVFGNEAQESVISQNFLSDCDAQWSLGNSRLGAEIQNRITLDKWLVVTPSMMKWPGT